MFSTHAHKIAGKKALDEGYCVSAHLLMYPDALILVALRGNHHIGLVQHENADFLDVECTILADPVQHFARCADQNVVVHLAVPFDCRARAIHSTPRIQGRGRQSRLF